jgi:predicted nucleic acid-binding protein
MPKRIKIYLDTSVPNAYFDDKNPFRKEITREFWKKLDDCWEVKCLILVSSIKLR